MRIRRRMVFAIVAAAAAALTLSARAGSFSRARTKRQGRLQGSASTRSIPREPMGLRVLAVVGFATVFVAGVVAMRAAPGTALPNPQLVVTTNLLDDPLAKFAKLMPALMNPRCVNCHGGSNPFTGVNHPNSMEEFEPLEARRIRDNFGDHDFRNVEKADAVCKECHNDMEAPQWLLPPRRMSFLNETPHEICSMWQLDKKDSGPALMKHLDEDILIKVAFKGSKGIVDTPPDPLEPIPGGRDKFLRLADEWLKTGNGDIPCAGWEGTITQTERVNLTTKHSTVIPGLEEHTTDTQDATRIITIVIGGAVNFRIAVQGSERSDSTVVASSGGQMCKSTMRMVRVYGTENGETAGEATTATLTFLPGGRYGLNLTGPDERTVRVERNSGTLCPIGPVPEEPDTEKFDHPGWTVSFTGVLSNPSDRRTLKGSRTEIMKRTEDAWLTNSGAAVTPLQAQNNGDLLPVPVEVTTTWDLRRRE